MQCACSICFESEELSSEARSRPSQVVEDVLSVVWYMLLPILLKQRLLCLIQAALLVHLRFMYGNTGFTEHETFI